MTTPPTERPLRERARAVLVMAVYLLIAQSGFAALTTLLVAPRLDAGFVSSGGLLAALREPGAPHLVEGLLPFLFNRRGWLAPLLGVFTLHALAVPWLQLFWLAGLDTPGPRAAGTLARRAWALVGAAVRVRLLLFVPLGLGLATLTIAVVYAQLVFGAFSDRSADLAALVAAGVGLLLLSPLRPLGDLAHAALVRAQRAGEPVSARGSVSAALAALAPRTYTAWGASAALGLSLLLLGAVGATWLSDWGAVAFVQLAACLRCGARGAWLVGALQTLSSRRLGSVTEKSAPPSSSSTFLPEIVPP